MTDISGTLAAIDEAIGCHQCGGGLGSSPSDDFCSEPCARVWSARRVGVAVTDGWGDPIFSSLQGPERNYGVTVNGTDVWASACVWDEVGSPYGFYRQRWMMDVDEEAAAPIFVAEEDTDSTIVYEVNPDLNPFYAVMDRVYARLMRLYTGRDDV